MDKKSRAYIEFEKSLSSLQSSANYFATIAIKESRVRRQYVLDISAMSKEIQHAVETGKYPPEEGAVIANKMRNDILDLSRGKSSTIGRAYAKSIKSKGRTLSDLQAKYSKDLFKKEFNNLDEKEQAFVYKHIVERAGIADYKIVTEAKQIGKVGRRILFVSLAISIYEVAQADDKIEEASRQVVSNAANFAGASAVGLAVVEMGVCAVTAPVCISLFALAGGIVAAYGVESMFGSIYQNLR